MDNSQPFYVASEVRQQNPLLIIDKKGTIGIPLARKLQEEFPVVLATALDMEAEKNIIHIPYHKRIPTIPDNAYSHLFLIYNGEKETLVMLSSFMRKAQQTEGKVFFVVSLEQ